MAALISLSFRKFLHQTVSFTFFTLRFFMTQFLFFVGGLSFSGVAVRIDASATYRVRVDIYLPCSSRIAFIYPLLLPLYLCLSSL